VEGHVEILPVSFAFAVINWFLWSIDGWHVDNKVLDSEPHTSVILVPAVAVCHWEPRVRAWA